MEKYIALPVLMWDERLSTNAVERVLIDEVDMTRKRRAEVVDKTAAAYILQGALDHMNRHTDPGENAEADDDDIEGEED